MNAFRPSLFVMECILLWCILSSLTGSSSIYSSSSSSASSSSSSSSSFSSSSFPSLFVSGQSTPCTYANLSTTGLTVAVIIAGPNTAPWPVIQPRGNPVKWASPWNTTANFGIPFGTGLELPSYRGLQLYIEQLAKRTNGTNFIPLQNGNYGRINIVFIDVGPILAPGYGRNVFNASTIVATGAIGKVGIVISFALGAHSVVLDACEATKKCLALLPFEDDVSLWKCTAAKPCPSKPLGARRRDYALGITPSPTFAPNTALSLLKARKVSTLVAIGVSDRFLPGTMLQIQDTARVLGIKMLYNYTFPPNNDLSSAGFDVIQTAGKIAQLNPEALYLGVSALSNGSLPLCQMMLEWKRINWMPKAIFTSTSADTELYAAMKRLRAAGLTTETIDISQYVWIGNIWSDSFIGNDFRAVSTSNPPNFEVIESDVVNNIESPAVFRELWRQYNGGRLGVEDGQTTDQSVLQYAAVSASAMNVAVKLFEKAGTDDPRALIAAAQQISTPSFLCKLQFDTYGQQIPIETPISQVVSSGSSTSASGSTMSSSSALILTPQAAAVDPVFPAPTWSERVFSPEGTFEGKHRVTNIAIVIVTSIAMVYGLFWLVWTFKFSKHAVVRASTPSFCYIVILGNLIMASSNYAALYTSQEQANDCVAAPWLLTIGFTLAYSALFAKTFRIWRIFQVNSGKLMVVSITTSLLFRIVGFWLLIDIIINSIWTGTTGMPMTLRVPDPYRISNNFYECDYSDSRPFILTHVAVKALLLFIGVALTIGVRNVPSAFNESTYMAVLIYNTAVLFAFILPIVAFVVGGREGTVNIRAYAILFIVMFNITILFLPKLLSIQVKSNDVYKTQLRSALSSDGNTSSGATPNGTGGVTGAATNVKSAAGPNISNFPAVGGNRHSWGSKGANGDAVSMISNTQGRGTSNLNKRNTHNGSMDFNAALNNSSMGDSGIHPNSSNPTANPKIGSGQNSFVLPADTTNNSNTSNSNITSPKRLPPRQSGPSQHHSTYVAPLSPTNNTINTTANNAGIGSPTYGLPHTTSMTTNNHHHHNSVELSRPHQLRSEPSSVVQTTNSQQIAHFHTQQASAAPGGASAATAAAAAASLSVGLVAGTAGTSSSSAEPRSSSQTPTPDSSTLAPTAANDTTTAATTTAAAPAVEAHPFAPEEVETLNAD